MCELEATSVQVGLVNRGYEQEQEREADRLGHALLKDAQIDPAGMSNLFRRLAEEPSRGSSRLSLHPPSAERVKRAASLPGLERAGRKLDPPRNRACFKAP